MRPTLHGNSQPWHAARTSVSSSYEEERSEVRQGTSQVHGTRTKADNGIRLLVEARAIDAFLSSCRAWDRSRKAMLGLISETAIEYRSGLRSPWLRTRVSSPLLDFCLQRCYNTSPCYQGSQYEALACPHSAIFEHELLTILWARGEMTALARAKAGRPPT